MKILNLRFEDTQKYFPRIFPTKLFNKKETKSKTAKILLQHQKFVSIFHSISFIDYENFPSKF